MPGRHEISRSRHRPATPTLDAAASSDSRPSGKGRECAIAVGDVLCLAGDESLSSSECRIAIIYEGNLAWILNLIETAAISQNIAAHFRAHTVA